MVNPPSWKTAVATASVDSSPATVFSYVDCPTDLICYAAGYNKQSTETFTSQAAVFKSEDGGKTWSTVFLGPNIVITNNVGMISSYLQGISCLSESRCVITESIQPRNGSSSSYVYLTTDGGTSWTASTWPSNISNSDYSPQQVYCQSALDQCVITGLYTISQTSGSAPFAWISTNGGSSFSDFTSLTNLVSGMLAIYSLSCSNAGICLAIVIEPDANFMNSKSVLKMILSTNDGLSWSTATVPNLTGSNDEYWEVDCYINQSCIVIGAQVTIGSDPLNVTFNPVVASTVNGGATWNLAKLDQNFMSGEISCTETVCFVTNNNGPYKAQGVIWEINLSDLSNSMVYNVSPNILSSISCVDSTHCVAVGGEAFSNPLNNTEVVTYS